MESGYTSTTSILHARAGFWRRFGGAFIDGLVIGVIRFIVALLIDANTASGVSLLVAAAYFTYFHGTTGQTPGDAAVSVRVVDTETGQPAGFGRAFIRWLVSIVSAMVFLLGYLWMLWDSEKQTWHDKAARTYVVPTS